MPDSSILIIKCGKSNKAQKYLHAKLNFVNDGSFISKAFVTFSFHLCLNSKFYCLRYLLVIIQRFVVKKIVLDQFLSISLEKLLYSTKRKKKDDSIASQNLFTWCKVSSCTSVPSSRLIFRLIVA